MDNLWTGTIDQIRFRPVLRVKGDIWIDWIEFTDGEPRKVPPRPDVASDHVVPKVSIPGISQEDFQDAFKVLDECLFTDVPLYGFEYPFLGPGGSYGECWWQFDTSLNVAGAKWANEGLAEGIIRGFIGVQNMNPDGRIDLFGQSVVRGQPADVSSMPWYFEAAYDVARRTGDLRLREEIYQSMKKYLEWWLSPVKRDEKTGLVTCTAEETHGEPFLELPATIAPVDLNVLVAEGCRNVSVLAESLGKTEETTYYRNAFNRLREAMNKYMWSETDGAYFNYNVHESKTTKRLLSTTFEPMRFQIAPPERVERLIPKLLDPALFNWGALPVTSLAKTEKGWGEAIGTYTGSSTNPWFGSVWTMRNRSVMAGLVDAGKHDLAAELNWATIRAFNRNYHEWIVPSTGKGEGVSRYGFSASLYIQAIIEFLFGIDYDRMNQRLRIAPLVPLELTGKELSIRNLILPTGENTRLNLSLRCMSVGEAFIEIEFKDEVIAEDLEIVIPILEGKKMRVTDHAGNALPIIKPMEGRLNQCGTRIMAVQSIRLHFESL